jgi:hypothetical protein
LQRFRALPCSAHGFFAAQRRIAHPAFHLNSNNLDGHSLRQSIRQRCDRFVNRRKFRLSHTTNRDDQIVHEIFLANGIVLSDLGIEQAEFAHLTSMGQQMAHYP